MPSWTSTRYFDTDDLPAVGLRSSAGWQLVVVHAPAMFLLVFVGTRHLDTGCPASISQAGGGALCRISEHRRPRLHHARHSALRELRAEGMSVLLALGLLAAGLGPTAHGLPGDTPDQKVTPGNETPVDSLRLASSNADFAFSLYRQLARKNPDKNVLFSPKSISTALAFLSLGARGRTLMEIHKGLKVNLTETSGTEIHQGFQRLLRALGRPRGQLRLSVGNAMFVSEQLKVLDGFRADAEALYASEALSTDFRDAPAAQRLINDYVREKTQGKLVDLVGDLDAGTAMVLVNYIFFK
ncbi:serpin A3-8-like, partial [Myotis lucifugus]|uniref:serpin A3-8-like n=1 Tax=Myotis lucifugus TaxID=59463 RepID=UPI000CCC6C82